MLAALLSPHTLKESSLSGTETGATPPSEEPPPPDEGGAGEERVWLDGPTPATEMGSV